jgi:hypothetical protein
MLTRVVIQGSARVFWLRRLARVSAPSSSRPEESREAQFVDRRCSLEQGYDPGGIEDSGLGRKRTASVAAPAVASVADAVRYSPEE